MEEQEHLFDLLRELSRIKSFREWRDVVAKPEIDRLEAELATPEELSEANIKAKIMHLNYVKGLFYRVFEAANAQKQIDQAD